MILETCALEAGYGHARVLKGLEIEVAEGEVLALLGRNGMGKTTLLRCLMGLIPPSRGEIRYAGQAIGGSKPYEIARLGLGYVPQGREVFADFTVEENLMLGLIGRQPAADVIPERVFQQFPLLAERLDQRAGTLSGGQQQQLAIARALAPGPRMLLLDEPSEGLQPSIVLDIAAVLRRIVQAEGLTVLLVEQNVDMALSVADRCAFIAGGQIAAEHTPGEVRADATILHRHLGL